MKRFLFLTLGMACCVAASTATAGHKAMVMAANKSMMANKATVANKPTAKAADKETVVDKTPVARLSAAQIVERSVAASGGVQAWRAVKAMVMSGQMEVGGKKNSTLPFVMTMERPKKSRFEVRFQGQTAFQVYDGSQGWKVRPFLGRNEVEPYTPEEAMSAAEASELDGLLVDYASKGTKIALSGVDTVEGHHAYNLKLTLKDGTERHVWVDASSFLQVKMDGEPRRFDGRMRPVTIVLRDYKTEGGLKVPHVIETSVKGYNPPHKMTIEHVAVNPRLDDSLFAKPTLEMARAAAQVQPQAH